MLSFDLRSYLCLNICKVYLGGEHFNTTASNKQDNSSRSKKDHKVYLKECFVEFWVAMQFHFILLKNFQSEEKNPEMGN